VKSKEPQFHSALSPPAHPSSIPCEPSEYLVLLSEQVSSLRFLHTHRRLSCEYMSDASYDYPAWSPELAPLLPCRRACSSPSSNAATPVPAHKANRPLNQVPRHHHHHHHRPRSASSLPIPTSPSDLRVPSLRLSTHRPPPPPPPTRR